MMKANAATAFSQERDTKIRMGILVYQLVAGLIYVGSQFSLVPPWRLEQFTASTALDFFPDFVSFAVNATVTLIFLVTSQIYGWKHYRHATSTLSKVMFDYKVPKQAFIFPTGMLMAMISDQMLPFMGTTVSPWSGFVISLISVVLLMYSTLSAIPEVLKDDVIDLQVKVRMMVKTLSSWVTIWNVFILMVWLLHAIDLYTPADKSSEMNENSPSPSPTTVHQKTSSQAVGVGLMFLATVIAIAVEVLSRAYSGIISGAVFMAFVSVDDHFQAVNSAMSFYPAIACMVIMLITFIINTAVTEVVCMPKLMKQVTDAATKAGTLPPIDYDDIPLIQPQQY